MNSESMMACAQSFVDRGWAAYSQWRLNVLRERLASLPSDCAHSREAAHAKYVYALRYIDKREKVDRIELEHQIEELEREL